MSRAATNRPRGHVRVVPLGGLGEIGKNITAIETDDDLVVIDCGLTFPREEGMFGVDIVVPDFTYLRERQHKLRALILTHAHEDHVGAVPFLLREMQVPQVIATKLTLGLVRSKVDEWGLLDATEWVEAVPEDEPMTVASFELEFVRVAHSVPDGMAVAVHTSAGTIFHTGDIKLDPAPLDGVPTDLGHVAEIGADEVALYLADSTQADVPGHTQGERTLAGPLRDVCSRAPGRIIVTCFSSHIHRIQQFLDIAQEEGRSVCIIGRSMLRNTNISRSLGFLDTDGADLIKPHQLADRPAAEVMIICTGSQGEPLAAMSRIASGTHPSIAPDPADTVIFSSRTIPGNELRVHKLQNNFAKVGSRVRSTDNAHVHVSGHASSAELTTMLQLVRPAAFMPVHGEWRHMRAHAGLGRLVGLDDEHIILAENGDVVELVDGVARMTGEKVHVGARLVDRTANEHVLDEVIEERQQASGDGMLVIVAHGSSGTLEVIARGIHDDGEGSMVDEARRAAEQSLREAERQHADVAGASRMLQARVEEAVRTRMRRTPLVVPIILDD